MIPSRDEAGGRGAGTLKADSSDMPAFAPSRASSRPKTPMLIVSNESFGRAWRLTRSNISVRLEVHVDVSTFGQHVKGYNVIGEIPGTDPALTGQYTLIGSHLDTRSQR